MASTAQAVTVPVKLTYDFSNDTLITEPAIPRFRVGDKIEFSSDQGDVHILLEPIDGYQPREYRTGDPPVVKTQPGNGMIWCGGTFRLNQVGKDPKTVIIDPRTMQWGSTSLDQ